MYEWDITVRYQSGIIDAYFFEEIDWIYGYGRLKSKIASTVRIFLIFLVIFPRIQYVLQVHKFLITIYVYLR